MQNPIMTDSPENVIREQANGLLAGDITDTGPLLDALAELTARVERLTEERDEARAFGAKLQKNIDSNLAEFIDWRREKGELEAKVERLKVTEKSLVESMAAATTKMTDALAKVERLEAVVTARNNTLNEYQQQVYDQAREAERYEAALRKHHEVRPPVPDTCPVCGLDGVAEASRAALAADTSPTAWSEIAGSFALFRTPPTERVHDD